MMVCAWHGAFGMPADWDHLRLHPLLVRHEIHCPLLWGASFSNGTFEAIRSGGEASSSRSAGLLAAAQEVRRQDAYAPVLMGYSLGGRLVLQSLPRLAAADQVRGAILISCHPGLPSKGERQARLDSDGTWLDKWHRLSVGEFLDEWESQPVLREPDADQHRRCLLEELLRLHPQAGPLALDTWSLGRQPDMRPFLSESTIPMLWITGEQDEKFTRLGGEIARLNPLIRHQTIPNCGHRMLWEAPERCAELVADFLESCGT